MALDDYANWRSIALLHRHYDLLYLAKSVTQQLCPCRLLEQCTKPASPRNLGIKSPIRKGMKKYKKPRLGSTPRLLKL